MRKSTQIVLIISFLFGMLLMSVMAACSTDSNTKYKISFDSNGGSFVAPITYVVDGENKMPAKPTQYGYKFDGWFFADGTEFVEGESEISSDIKLKAKWSKGEYTIKFDTDDLIEVEPITAIYGTPIELPKLSPIGGCPFIGWFKEDLNTPLYIDVMPGEDMVAYALWDAGITTGTGTVKVDEKGNCYTTMKRTLAVFSNYRISAGEYSVTVDYANVKSANGNNFGLIFALTEPTSSSYWESGLGLSYYYFHIAIDIGAIQLAKVRGDHTLIYESKKIVMLQDNTTGWKEKYNSNDNISTFSVSWKSGEINCYIDGELQISYVDNSPILYGNKIGVRSVGAGLTFDSVPVIKPVYCARFDTDGAGNISPCFADDTGKITLPGDPYKKGYDFNCWKIKNGTDYVDFNVNEPLTSDIELKAFYTPKKYQIHLHRYLEDVNATDVNGVIEQEYLSEINLPTPSRSGKVFEGWYFGDGLTRANDLYMPLNGVDLYAKWSDDCVVTFDCDNGETYAQFVRKNSLAVSPQENPKKYGHNFVKWNLDQELYNFNSPVLNDITLKAIYEKGIYTFTYYALNSANPDEIYAQKTLEFGTEINLPNPVKEGWEFIGWFDEDLCTKIETTTMLGENRKLYAGYCVDGGVEIHNVRGSYKKEIDKTTNEITYRAEATTSVGTFSDVEFTEGCISIQFDFSSWSPRAGFMFNAKIPDGSLDSNWEMAEGVEYYTFNMDMGLGSFGLGKVVNGTYVTLKSVYIENNLTSFKEKYYNNITKTKIIVSVKIERVGEAQKIEFFIDGEKQLEYTDNSPLSGTNVGLSSYYANTKFRDFVIVDITSKGD